MVSQTEEALGYAAEGKKFADANPVSTVTAKDAVKFIAEMTPILGDAIAAKELWDEATSANPNWGYVVALGGATAIGLIPGAGDVLAKGIKSGAKKVFDVAKRVEVDPNTMGSGLGNVTLKSKEKPLKERISIQPVNQSNLEARGLEYKAGGEYINPVTKEILTGKNAGSVNIKIKPEMEVRGGRPQASMDVADLDVAEVGSKGTDIKVNLVKPSKTGKKAGWNWLSRNNKDLDTNTLISVTHKNQHYYTLETDFSKGANLKTYPNQVDEPRLRPTVKGDIELIESIGTIKLRGKEHPVYNKIRTFSKGGVVPMNNQMQQFAEGGLKDEGGEIDEVSGNEVPIGGTKEGVRDDIPANVSEGEFIFPADVVRFVGLDKLMSIRQDAKMGLKQMEAMGQMGNSDEATVDDSMPFSMADLVVVGGKGEPMELAAGGFVPVENYTEVQDMISSKAQKGAGVQNFEHGGTPHKKLTFSDLMGGKEPRLVMYVNEAGDKYMVPFVDGVPLFPIPAGYFEYVPPELVEGEVASPEDLETAAIVAAVNSSRGEKEYDPFKDVDTKPVNWMDPEMNGEEFLQFVKDRNSYGTVRNAVEAAFSFIPVVGFLGKMAFRDSDKNILAALNKRAEAGEFNTPELQKLALFTAGEVEKAGTSIIGKVIEAVGGLFGKDKEEIGAVVQLQSIIDNATGDKAGGDGAITIDNGAAGVSKEITAAVEAGATADVDPFAPGGAANTLGGKNFEVLADQTPAGRDIGSEESIVSGMSSVPAASSTNIVPSAPTDTSYDIGSQMRTNAQMLPNDYLFSPATLSDGNLQSDKYPTLGQVTGGPAVPFSTTSNSLRNIFAGPDDGSRGSELFTPATISKTEGTSTEPVDTTTGTPGFRDRSASSTTDLESTQTPKTPELNAFEKIAKVTSGFVKKIINALPGQSIDAAGNPIVTTDDGDGSGNSSSDSGSIVSSTEQGQAPGGGYGIGSGGQTSTVGQMTTPSYVSTVDAATVAAAEEETRLGIDVDNTEDDDEETYFSGPQQYIAKGGLIARPKKKVKKKTTNKRGLAARK